MTDAVCHRRIGRGIWCVFCGFFSLLLGAIASLMLVQWVTHPADLGSITRVIAISLSGLSLALSLYVLLIQLRHIFRIVMRRALPAVWHVAKEAGLWLIAAALLIYPIYLFSQAASGN
jgi:hypothetical protein